MSARRSPGDSIVYTGTPIDAGFRINEASVLKWSDVDFDNGVIYLYRSKVSNDDFIPMTNRLQATLSNRHTAVEGEYLFPGRFGGHKTIQNNRALEAAFRRAGVPPLSPISFLLSIANNLLIAQISICTFCVAQLTQAVQALSALATEFPN